MKRAIGTFVICGLVLGEVRCCAQSIMPYLTPALSLPLARAGEGELFDAGWRGGGDGFSTVNEQGDEENMKLNTQWKTLTRDQRRAWNAWAKSNKVQLDDRSLRYVSGHKAMTIVLRNRA